MKYLILILFLLPFAVTAQTISGTVSDGSESMIGANVYWSGTTLGTSTDENGKFELEVADQKNNLLVVSFIGYESDTLNVQNLSEVNFTLSPSEILDEVVISEKQEGVIISSLSAIKVEQITETELGKAACCDLAGCFGTQSTVQSQTTNVVTNSKELRILGLPGVYTQILVDGFPMLQGLSYTYGISGIPGTLVKSIYVSKGANSVLQGYESISGQINVITQDPANTDRLLLNAYMNSFGEKQFNANFSAQKGKWSNLTAAHTTQPANEFDRDEDTFLDVPKLNRYMLFNKTKYGIDGENGWHSEIGLRYLNEKRRGGQTKYANSTDPGTGIYEQEVEISQPEFMTKTGYRINDRNKLVLFASGFHQNQTSKFGTVDYEAEQSNFYANLQHEFDYGGHNLKAGLSYRYLDLEEEVSFEENLLERTFDGKYKRLEKVAGVFAENTMTLLDERLTWIAGLRVDRHNEFGSYVTPRTVLKFDATTNTVLRASIGTGWRTVNLFSENINLLVSSRDIVFAETLKPEEALNAGFNVTKKFQGANVSGFVSGDLYHTNFQNQIFPDYDSDASKAIIENFTGRSVSNIAQLEVYANFFEQIEFKTGYSFLDVFREVEGEKMTLPFNSKHKVLVVLGYQPLSEKFHIDLNMHWFGEQYLPDTSMNPVEFQRPDKSEAYSVFGGQFTYNFDKIELYAGCENIFAFRQEQPIVAWEDPFGSYFDTSSVWGPTRGRELYGGIRFRLGRE